jgi:hypothetical protein
VLTKAGESLPDKKDEESFVGPRKHGPRDRKAAMERREAPHTPVGVRT